MKKRHGINRAVQPIGRDQLEGMTTGALLARLQRLRWCEDDRESSDVSDAEIATVADLILFKADLAWVLAYADVRAVLSKRGHLENKPARRFATSPAISSERV